MILMNCITSQNVSASETEIINPSKNINPFGFLDFPEDYRLVYSKNGLFSSMDVISSRELFAFDKEGFKQILIIHREYKNSRKEVHLLRSQISLKNQEQRKLETKINSLEDSLLRSEYAVETLQTNRELLMNLYEEEIVAHAKSIRDKKLKTILIVSGVSVGSFAIGLIVGLLAF